MAQLDTGLGWEAKAEWLKETTGVVASIGGVYFINYPNSLVLPKISDPNSIINDGVLIGTSNRYGGPYEVYAASSIEGTILCTTTSYSDYFAANLNSGKLYIAYKKVGSSSWNYSIDVNMSSSYGGFRYTTAHNNTAAIGATQYIPSIASPLSEVGISTYDFTKDNAGYAVACVAIWKTQANVIVRSPILISTDSSFTDMTGPVGAQLAKYNTIRDGMRFYMAFFQNITQSITTSLPVYDISGPDEPYANLDELFDLICALDQANVRVTETVDPYEDFPHTDEDAGETDPDPEDDDIEEEDLPTMSFATAGFCRIYRPSFSQVSALASYMWTDQNFLQTVINHLKQILENPIDAIISLSIVPCVPNVLADEEVKVMYVPTGVYMPPVQRQFVSVDCGSYTLKEMYGSALDYNPYTSVQLYLPYVGIVQLDTDEVMGKTISIGYRIDVVTGVCCAYVKANNDVLYQFSGHCSIHQPITSADFSGYINAALAAGKLVASIAAAGAGAPAVAATLAGAPTPSISGTESKTVETERNPNTGRQITVGTRRRESQTYNPGASFGEVATRGVSNTVGAVMNSKTIVQHSGGFSGNSGFMAAVRRPYLIVTRPRIANPENYGKYNGRPSMIYLNLGDCTGFTQVQSIQLTGIDATNPELSEIATLLNSGVIL